MLDIDLCDISYSQPEWDDGFLDIKADWNAPLHEVGDIKCRLHDDGSVEIEDILIRDDYPIPNSWLRKVFRCPIRTLNFQGRSIGSCLLKRAIQEARNIDATMIWGSVVETDPVTLARVLRWYESFGFKSANPNSQCLPNTIKMVSLKL
jgi:GNAT superfamily N-acetyltransferase